MKITEKWNLTDIYKNQEEWQKDFDYCVKFLDKLENFKGKMNNPKDILEFIKTFDDSELAIKQSKLSLYYYLLASLNTNDENAKKMEALYEGYNQKYSEASIFFTDELNKLGPDKVEEIFNNKELLPYKYAFNAFMDKTRVIYSAETMKALNISNKGKYGASDIYDSLLYSDMKYPKMKIDGKELLLNQEGYDKIKFGKYPRSIKEKAYNLFFQTPVDYTSTFTSLLNNFITDCISNAKLQNYKKSIDYALHSEEIDKTIFENILKCSNKLIPSLQKLVKLREKKLGHKEYVCELTINTSKYSPKIKYEDGVKNVRNALSVLGDDYIDLFDKMISSGHIDVYPKKGKDTGGFQIDCLDKSVLPYILMNFTGFENQVSTFAHEMGHALYSYFSMINPENNLTNCSPCVFTHEIASIINEFLYFTYMYKNAKSKDEKLYYLESLLGIINSCLLRQILYTEFELFCYDLVENDKPLTKTDLNKKWIDLIKKYYGKSIQLPKGYETEWTQIPHFYMNYYVYKYATSATYACILSNEILNGRTENYRKFLELGATDTPGNILKKIGVNISDEKTYDYVINYYNQLIDEYKQLTGGNK